jgi:hypothetical protein
VVSKRRRITTLHLISLPILLALVPAISSEARADRAKTEPTAVDKETARALMDEGDKHMEAQSYEAALKAYQAAHDIMFVPTTGLEVARALAALRRLIEARDMSLWVIRYPQSAREPAAFTKARSDAESLAAELEPKIPSVHLDVKGPPSDAPLTVSFDGAVIPPSAVHAARKLNPGEHLVVVSAENYGPSEKRFMLKEGEQAQLTITLSPRAAAPTPPRSQDATGSEPSRSLSPLTYVGFGIGGAGLIAGSLAGAFSLAAASRAEDKCPLKPRCPVTARDDIDTAILLANVSNVGFALGAIGVGVGIFGLVAPGGVKATPVSSIRVRPAVGYRRIDLSFEF